VAVGVTYEGVSGSIAVFILLARLFMIPGVHGSGLVGITHSLRYRLQSRGRLASMASQQTNVNNILNSRISLLFH
jgi:hypothetical protein